MGVSERGVLVCQCVKVYIYTCMGDKERQAQAASRPHAPIQTAINTRMRLHFHWRLLHKPYTHHTPCAPPLRKHRGEAHRHRCGEGHI